MYSPRNCFQVQFFVQVAFDIVDCRHYIFDKMLEMKEFAKTHRKFSFRDLLKKQCSKVQVIVTFLSVLELIKMGHIHVVQEEIFDDIQINVVTEPETWKNLTEFAEEEG